MVELTQEHLKATVDSAGNIKVEIINAEEFEQKLVESEYPAPLNDLQNMVESYNEYLTSSTENTTGGPTTYANVPVEDGGGGTVDTSGISCDDALSIIGLIHSGSYAYTTYLFICSVGIPFITASAYTVASIMCD